MLSSFPFISFFCLLPFGLYSSCYFVLYGIVASWTGALFSHEFTEKKWSGPSVLRTTIYDLMAVVLGFENVEISQQVEHGCVILSTLKLSLHLIKLAHIYSTPSALAIIYRCLVLLVTIWVRMGWCASAKMYYFMYERMCIFSFCFFLPSFTANHCFFFIFFFYIMLYKKVFLLWKR